jgi:hypothetical protein
MRRSKNEWIHRKLPRLACTLLLLGFAVACASRAPEAAAPEQPSGAGDDSPEAEAVSEDSASSSADVADDASATPEETAASGPVDVQTFQNALQAVIGDSGLLTALGIDPSSSQTVLISGKDLPEGLERAAAVRSVEVVPVSDKPSKRTILHFTSIELDATRGTFKYRIERTGAYGTTRVAYDGEAWQLKSSRVSKP